jgi:hypothetical protein
MLSPGHADARVRQGIEAWHLPPLQARVEAVTWRLLASHALALGYRDAVAALIQSGFLRLPGEG